MAQPEHTAFSSAAEDAITRTIPLAHKNETVSNPTTQEELARLERLYEVEWTADEISRAGYKQVALQFPDELLHISVPIYQGLKRRLDSETGVYILADTSYGSCCVDEVAAQHIDADVIVHYGYSCLSSPSRLPVLYVFSKAELDVADATQSLIDIWRQYLPEPQESPPQHFILIPDVAYAHLAEKLHASLAASLPSGSRIVYDPVPKRAYPSPSSSSTITAPRSLSEPTPQSPTADWDSDVNEPSVSHSHRRYTLPPSVLISSCTILYVGPESLGLTNLLMTHPENKVISYDPTSQPPQAKLESARTNKLLMRRYAVVQRARDADVIGILVGTLGVASYLPLLSHIRTLLRENRKKSYTLSVGKLSPSKLANFPEIECFVLVACPENSVIDAKVLKLVFEFLRPIVTPFELSLALSPEPSWLGNYILDFERVIEYQNQNDQMSDKDAPEGEVSDPDLPVFSLVTGKYRHAKRYGDETSLASSADPSAVILRNTDNALTTLSSSAGTAFLRQRTFQGLEQHLGEDAPSVLEQGRSGIARGYKDDHQLDGGER